MQEFASASEHDVNFQKGNETRFCHENRIIKRKNKGLLSWGQDGSPLYLGDN